MSYINSHPAPFPTGSFAARQGLRPADATPFSHNIRLTPDRVLARHIDSAWKPLGWEVYSEGRNGRPAVNYPRGARKGLVATSIPRWKGCEIILVEGALAALAAAALNPAGLGETMMVVGLGGHWNTDVLDELDCLAVNARACCINVAISDHHPAGQRMREQALAGLENRIFVRPLPSPPDGWRATLVAARIGPATPGG
ncbi:hypothetical protein [Roseomonas harenae]|uniref:hypothetical protein n=1 Tax=Muricoccus harenae TaxID=2692566 RepID=UPI001331435E|nr:hypothetical protein [Roseomonas harenae]